MFTRKKQCFFNVGLEVSIYTLYSQEKSCFFQCGIGNPLVYILYVPKKKNYVFSMWDLKLISIYTLCSQEKSYLFSMWDLKPISIYTLCSQEKNYVFLMWDNKLFWFKYFNLKA
jgi:hypothetical protein